MRKEIETRREIKTREQRTFVFYLDWIEPIKMLTKYGTEEDQSAFWDAVKTFVTTREEVELPQVASMIFAGMKGRIAEDLDRYSNTRRVWDGYKAIKGGM